MHITLRQMKVFESVARLLSYTQAAKELHLSQPAVSMQVKQLEEQVGLPLFEQLGKQVYLTEAGRETYHYCRTIAQQLDDLSSVINNLKGLGHGHLTISLASTANYFVPTLLGIFCQRFPGITISLDVTNRESLLQRLRDNQTDLVIMGQPPSGMELEASPFMENPLVIVAPPQHPLTQGGRIKLKQLEQHTFLVRERGSGTRDSMERFFQQHAVHIHAGMEISSNEAIKQSVQAGLGLGLLSRYTLEMELALKRLVVLDVEGFPIKRHWYIMHREGKRLSTVAQTFKDFLLQESQQILQPMIG